MEDGFKNNNKVEKPLKDRNARSKSISYHKNKPKLSKFQGNIDLPSIANMNIKIIEEDENPSVDSMEDGLNEVSDHNIEKKIEEDGGTPENLEKAEGNLFQSSEENSFERAVQDGDEFEDLAVDRVYRRVQLQKMYSEIIQSVRGSKTK